MIFPDEYKLVGIKDRERRGESVYFATEYLISRDGPRLYHVKSRGSGFMREVVELEPIASGREIMFYPDIVDTRNRARLIELANGVCRSGKANTVVFRGQDEHITFVKDPDPTLVLTIEVLDVSPPNPPWLVHVLSGLEACGILGDLTVRFVPRILDLRRFDCDCVYYPCRASGLGRSLDTDIVVHEHPQDCGLRGLARDLSGQLIPARISSLSISAPCTVWSRYLNQRGLLSPAAVVPRGGARPARTARRAWWCTGEMGPARIAEAVRCLVQDLRK